MNLMQLVLLSEIQQIQSSQTNNIQGVNDSTNNLFAQIFQALLQNNAQSLPTVATVPTQTSTEEANTTSAPSSIDGMIAASAHKYGVDSNLVKQVISAESGFNPDATSRVGAEGLMQLMPGTATSLGVTNPLNPAQNIDAGTHYLKNLLNQFGGNVQLALAGYNAGPGAVEKYGGIPPYRETQNYVKKILSNLPELDETV